jgi:ribosome biogenesis protein Nip4
MIKPIDDFVSLFGASVSLDESLVVKKRNRYFLLSASLKKLALKDFFYAGTYLGKVKNGRFFPGFDLLRMMAEKKANEVVVNKKTEWLFICGRDVFKRGIVKVIGPARKGDHVLVLNYYGECLGFGRVVSDLGTEENSVAIKNISDIGDFLRREERTLQKPSTLH